MFTAVRLVFVLFALCRIILYYDATPPELRRRYFLSHKTIVSSVLGFYFLENVLPYGLNNAVIGREFFGRTIFVHQICNV